MLQTTITPLILCVAFIEFFVIVPLLACCLIRDKCRPEVQTSSTVAVKRRQTIPIYRPRSIAAREFDRQSPDSRSAGAFGELSRAVPPAFSLPIPNAGRIPALLDATSSSDPPTSDLCLFPPRLRASAFKSSFLFHRQPTTLPLLLRLASFSASKVCLKIPPFDPLRYLLFKSSSSSIQNSKISSSSSFAPFAALR